MWRWLAFTLLLAIAALPAPAAIFDISTPIGSVQLRVDDLKVRNIGGRATGAVVIGAAVNRTSAIIRQFHFALVGLDQNGNDLRMCDLANIGQACEIWIFDPMNPGASVDLRQPGNIILDSRPLEQGRRLTSLQFRFLGGTFTPNYSIRVARFERPSVRVIAALDAESGIGLKLQNTSDTPVWIDWSSSSFTGLDGTSGPVIPDGVPFLAKMQPIQSLLVPPHATVEKLLYPSDLIQMTNDGWVKVPVLPASIRLSSELPDLSYLVGKSAQLFLTIHGTDNVPLYINLPFLIEKATF